jgi:hypothetical protein
MSDAFSEYVALLDDVEQIPLAVREFPTLSTEQRAETMERMVQFVRRGRVLPQSDREEAGLEALFYGGAAPAADDQGAAMRGRDHETILAPVDELARADPWDQAGVQCRSFCIGFTRRSRAISARLS